MECAELHVVDTGKVIDHSICHPHFRDSVLKPLRAAPRNYQLDEEIVRKLRLRC